ncbi:hypothetical protein [Chryseobacterium sp. EO14]|uniref:hypothetical protein n=1 Tax=Chryseobacterium sp. EO14 TaxID=2950551 RepID=UPI00210CA250|nr:hypothetical protein [Chryseobacterium sp. EO14]MCQ4139234.1 hypothetical protein [Chryseobacterium sp. EO14]
MGTLSEKLLKLQEFAESGVPLDLILIAVNETKANFQNRIFNSEEGAKDAKGKGLGKYSNRYAKYRQAKGRQTKVVDLELTGSLRRDFKVLKNENNIAIKVTSESEQKKVKYLEENYKTKIFSLNDEEYNACLNKSARLILDEIINIYKNG